MPRSPHTDNPLFPYHVTARCINKEWFCIPLESVWKTMEYQLYFLVHAFGFQIHSFVLMNNHFHLIVRAPKENLSKGMATFMREVSRNLTKSVGRINQCWGSRYFRSLIMSDHYYQHVYKYVYRNPVEAGLSSRAEEYRWSTLGGLLGQFRLVVPLQEDTILFSDMDDTLMWLNSNPKDGFTKKVEVALKRRVFEISRCQRTKKPHPLKKTRL